jgi:hypothetical protein
MSGTYVESSLTEERENLASRLNLSVPVSYPSISQPINTNPSHSPQSQNSSNSFYASPSRTSGTATIQPPEQVANIREGPFSSAPPSERSSQPTSQKDRIYNLQPGIIPVPRLLNSGILMKILPNTGKPYKLTAIFSIRQDYIWEN